MSKATFDGLPKRIRSALEDAGLTPDMAAATALEHLAEVDGIGPQGLVALATWRRKTGAVAAPDTPAAPAAPTAPTETSDDDDDDEVVEPTISASEFKEFTVALKIRHAIWVEQWAKQSGQTTSQVIEWCVRQAYAADTSRLSGDTVLRADFDPEA